MINCFLRKYKNKKKIQMHRAPTPQFRASDSFLTCLVIPFSWNICNRYLHWPAHSFYLLQYWCYYPCIDKTPWAHLIAWMKSASTKRGSKDTKGKENRQEKKKNKQTMELLQPFLSHYNFSSIWISNTYHFQEHYMQNALISFKCPQFLNCCPHFHPCWKFGYEI